MPYNVLGAGSASGYEIEQSLRFNDDDSAYLSRTPASAGNRKTWTWSGWVKRGNLTSSVGFFSAGQNSTDLVDAFEFNGSNQIRLYSYSSGYLFHYETTSVYRDVSSWYHIVVAVDTTQATAGDRVKLYINGSQVTAFATQINPTQNSDCYYFNNTNLNVIGATYNNFRFFDGYIAEVNFIDGQALTPSDFGETDLLTNQWIPKKYVGTYGTNGFYLDFGNSGSLGADSSGNGNNFTPTNLAATDQVLDSPTNNFATLNPLFVSLYSYHTFNEGNLRWDSTSYSMVDGSIGMSSGKWYWEVYQEANNSNTTYFGIVDSLSRFAIAGGEHTVLNANVTAGGDFNTSIIKDGTSVQSGLADFEIGHILGIAYDADNLEIDFYLNGSQIGVTQSVTSPNSGVYVPMLLNANGASIKTAVMNFGQDSSFAGNKTAQGNTDANGKGDFYYTPPSGYLALCEDNLPDPSIALPGDHFEAVVYVGDGNSTQEVTTSFEPDLIWNKNRTTGYHHRFFDRVRGLDKSVYSNKTSAEDTYQDYGYPTATSSTSVTVGQGTDSGNLINVLSSNYVLWNWKADNTSGSSNTDGTITSTVSANTTAGFSIVSYATGGLPNATVGHGLSQSPEIIITKQRDVIDTWFVLTNKIDGSVDYLALNTTAAKVDYASGAFTSSTFTNGYAASSNVIAYCFHSVEGYSKFGTYTGNGSTDGTFVYTGFRPAFVIIKRTDVSGDSWFMFDTARDTFNPLDSWLGANLSNTEGSNTFADSLSNGFKLRGSISAFNGSGSTYIYMAFAESPFKYSNAR